MMLEMAVEWVGGDDRDDADEYTLVDTGTQFALVRKTQPRQKHDYEASETPPHKMHTDPPCTCGEPKKSPVHK